MRQLNVARGITLIEVMVAVAICAILALTAAPSFSEYMQNSRLREGGHSLMAEALFAQSEALKRNGQVQLVVAGSTMQVIDVAVPPGTTLRTRTLADGLSADSVTVTFNSAGMPFPFPTDVAIDISSTSATCSSQARCPGLRVDAGGAMRLCGNKLACT